MKLSPAAFAVSAALVWGAAIFVIGGINSVVPGYGEPVLALVVSLYPGYDASGGLGDLLLGTVYAVFDGLAGGFVFALLYNAVAGLAARGAERTPTVAMPRGDTELPAGPAENAGAPPDPASGENTAQPESASDESAAPPVPAGTGEQNTGPTAAG